MYAAAHDRMLKTDVKVNKKSPSKTMTMSDAFEIPDEEPPTSNEPSVKSDMKVIIQPKYSEETLLAIKK